MESSAIGSTPRARTLSERKQRLLAELRRRREQRPSRPTRLHRLRNGDGPPVVLVHPVGGQVFSYIDLVSSLAPGPAAYALEADEGLSGDTALSLPELAARYWQRLEAADLRPGVLVGWSFGGVLAYEMVRQGPRVPLVLIDSMPRPAMYDGMTRTEAQHLEAFFHDLLRSAGDPADVATLPRETWGYPPDVAIAMAEAALAARGSRLNQSAAELQERYRVHRNASSALDSYTPEPADVRLHLVRAARWDGPDATEAWRALVGDENLVSIDVDADHYGILRAPAVDTVHSVIDGVVQGRNLDQSATAATTAVEAPEVSLVLRPTGASGVHGRLDFDPARCDEAHARAMIEAYLAGAPASVDVLPHEHVAQIAAEHPDAVAIRWAAGELSYRELVTKADALAARLTGADRVAVCHRRTPQLYVAILAVLRAGAGYVPIDPDHPDERRNFILTDSGAQVLLCDPNAPEQWQLPAGCRVEPITSGAPDPPTLPRPAVGMADLAYVMYTSGSTGKPKGVAMPHGPLANLLRWQRARSASGPGDRTLQFSAFTFDASFQEIFSTWTTGGTLVLADDELRQDPRRLVSWLEEQRINRLFLPFVGLRLLADAAAHTGRIPTHLREVITAGEQLRVTPAVRAFFQATEASLDNQYGPTESHVVTAEMLDGDPAGWDELPLIGAAIDRAVVEVCDESLCSVAAGEAGEICLSGPVLADGYIGRPDLTARAFATRPDGTRVYRTGDVGRMRDDRRFEYLGRADNQVKISGHRVEPAEVESALCNLVSVADAVVLSRRDTAVQETVLAGYLVGVEGCELDVRTVRRELAAVLPAHLVPQHLLAMPALPLGNTGKVDRLALAAMPLDPDACPAAASEPAADDEEDAMVTIGRLWHELLGRNPEPSDSFFELGGNSLNLALLAMRLEEQFGVPVLLPNLFTHNTLEAQVALLERLFLAEVARFSDEQTNRTLDEVLEPRIGAA